MMAFSGLISRFVERHPTIKMLALSFLILIGIMLVADGTGWHVPKGYIYFSMAFALGVEMLNIWVRARSRRKQHAEVHRGKESELEKEGPVRVLLHCPLRTSARPLCTSACCLRCELPTPPGPACR